MWYAASLCEHSGPKAKVAGSLRREMEILHCIELLAADSEESQGRIQKYDLGGRGLKWWGLVLPFP